MKRLKTKTFYTLFFILSSVLIILLFAFNYQNYRREHEGIKNSLRRIHNIFQSHEQEKFMEFPNTIINDTNFEQDFDKRIIMDYEVYTIFLNSNNEITDIIHHSDTPDADDKIQEVADSILKENSEDVFSIGSLYFSQYSYHLKNYHSLVIVDNSNVQNRLVALLKTSCVAFVLFELLIIYLSKVITNWITKPALDSFQKQKEFIADASHELKTPLAVIMASADLLKVGKEQERWLSNIKQETEKMNHLISSLLDLSRLENGVDKNSYTLENLSKIISKSILTFESLAFEKQVLITSSVKEDLFFKCNALEINELVSILLDNAIKHSKKDKSIHVVLKVEKDEIIFSVTNIGDTIPKDELEKIFERFYRSDKSRNRNTNRYGLGLAIAKNIVMNHNGKIAATSKDGVTTFKVIFKHKER